jgi:hypothetical protein
MAVQLQVAYFQSIFGTAVFAGGPYYCAQASVVSATDIAKAEAGSMSGPTRTTSWSFIRKPRRPRPIHWDAGIGGDTPAPIMRSRVRRKIDAIMTMVAQITSGYTPAK